MLRCDSEVA